MSNSGEEDLLSALAQVRASLHESFQGGSGQPNTFCSPGIQTDFPIEAITDSTKHHGWCEFTIGGSGWTTSKGPAVQRANEYKVYVRQVAVRILRIINV